MKKYKRRFERWSIDRIVPYENNPRRNDEAVADVVASIQQCGECDPIEVNEQGVILSGHTRLKALQQLGETEADVIVYEGMPKSIQNKYRLLANKAGEKAGWDFEKLSIELDGMDFDGFDFGFEKNTEDYIDGFFEDGVQTKPKEEVFGVKIYACSKVEAEQLKTELEEQGYKVELM